MSKKLIAVASAAALALTGLVGVAPASATAASIAWTSASGAGTSASPYTRAVPQENSIASGTNAQIITVTNLLAGDSVTVSVSGSAAKVAGDVIAASTIIDVRNLGAATLTKTISGSSTSTNFYVFDTKAETNSTVTVTVTETDGGTRSTTTQTSVYKATAGVAHAVTNVSAPATLANGVRSDITFNVTDVFGNVLETANIATAVTGGTTNGIATWDANRKLHVASITSASNSPFIVTIDGNTTSTVNPTNVGLGAGTTEVPVVINNTGAATQISTLTAQVAALTTQLAATVTKMKYNKLARKWNRANPSNKVKLVK